jgi:antirestriction protein ArdC
MKKNAAERRSALLQFFANPPRELAEAAIALRAADDFYSNDTDRELADIEAGRHPLQQPKAKSSAG